MSVEVHRSGPKNKGKQCIMCFLTNASGNNLLEGRVLAYFSGNWFALAIFLAVSCLWFQGWVLFAVSVVFI